MSAHAQPLAEVFGFMPEDQSVKATRYRSQRLCPFNNKVPNCTKDKAKNPLGVCSIFYEGDPVITCPIRFREDWIITDEAAIFFFGANSAWTSLTEVRLNDAHGRSAGNIDLVLVSYDHSGKVLDFGALEIQAVYISGNVRDPFEQFINDPTSYTLKDWATQPTFPRPDFLSSSRKRLAPQLLFKGGILHSWEKRMAVALNRRFFETLPPLKRLEKSQADLAWFLYDFEIVNENNFKKYKLKKVDEIYTEFSDAISSIITPTPGKIDDFMRLLQEKLDEKLEAPPTNSTIEKPF
jgi:hypothetical protein